MPHLIVSTDTDFVREEVEAALGGPDTTVTVCRSGNDVVTEVARQAPDLAVLDLQVGNMGGMATAMALHHDESVGRLPHVKILMLLDRVADIHLARRSNVEGWLVKPLDPLRLRRAATTILEGGTCYEHLPADQPIAAGEAVTPG